MLHQQPTPRRFLAYEERIAQQNPIPSPPRTQSSDFLFSEDRNRKGTAVKFATWGEASNFYNWLLVSSNVDCSKDGNRVWIEASGKQVKGLLADYRGSKGRE
jgi:hypothetical protein